VRVARALRQLPLTSAALADGCLSYAQARAITRIAAPGDEGEWVELARHLTAAQLDKTVSAGLRARATDLPLEERPTSAARVRWNPDGTCTLSVTLAPEVAAVVLDVLEQAQHAEQADRDTRLAQVATELSAELTTASGDAEGASAEAPQPYIYVEPDYPLHLHGTPQWDAAYEAWKAERDRRRALRDAWREHQVRLAAQAAARHVLTGPATLADALVRLVLRPHEQGKVTVKLLHDPLGGWTRTRADQCLPPASLDALRRLIPVQKPKPKESPVDLRAHDQGRRSRTAPPALRALLGALDGERCRFPGCDHTRYLHAHHVVFWEHGGRTDLDNLVLMCSHHHQYLHTNGYQLVLHPDRHLDVRTSTGIEVARVIPLPRASAEALPTAAARAIPTGGRFDLSHVVNVMLAHAA
jgi:hypothetical protein